MGGANLKAGGHHLKIVLQHYSGSASVSGSHRDLPYLLKLWLRRAEDALCIFHLWAAIAGVVHLKAIIEFVQILLHLPDLFPGNMLQPKANLFGKGTAIKGCPTAPACQTLGFLFSKVQPALLTAGHEGSI